MERRKYRESRVSILWVFFGSLVQQTGCENFITRNDHFGIVTFFFQQITEGMNYLWVKLYWLVCWIFSQQLHPEDYKVGRVGRVERGMYDMIGYITGRPAIYVEEYVGVILLFTQLYCFKFFLIKSFFKSLFVERYSSISS